MGGKRRLARHFLPLFPAHTCDVEPFCGAAALYFMKEPSKVEVINDIHGELINLYRVIKHHLDEFVRQFRWALVSRQIYRWMKDTPEETLTDIQRAARFFYLQKQALGGKVADHTFGTTTTSAPRLNLLRIEEELPLAHLRLSRTTIEHLDWATCINTAAATSLSPLDPSGSSTTKFSNTRTDIYQTVTDSIIAALEAGVKPWSCPWQRVSGMSGLPSNYATGAVYSGMNIMLLWCSASKQGFSDSRWMTYKQAQVVGGQVRTRERGTTAIFYTTLEKENDAGEIDHIPMLKTFTVFNVQQIDGLPLTKVTVSPEATFAPLPQAENLFRKSGANIIEKGQNVFFSPSTDEVWLPERHLFADAVNFYATGLHELVHWSGGKKRLNREMKGKFGSADYAEEELVAGLGSAFLMADLGVYGEVQHESYIASWLKALKNDKRYIFKAASAAAKAHSYLIGNL